MNNRQILQEALCAFIGMMIACALVFGAMLAAVGMGAQ